MYNHIDRSSRIQFLTISEHCGGLAPIEQPGRILTTLYNEATRVTQDAEPRGYVHVDGLFLTSRGDIGLGTNDPSVAFVPLDILS